MESGKDFNAPSVSIDKPLGSVLILTDDKTEDLELFYPYYRLTEAGYRVDVATPEGGTVKAKHGETLYYTQKLENLDITRYDMIYIPGGEAPASLRKDTRVIEQVQRFAATGKPIASICHGPQLLTAADLVQGRRIAAWPELAKEIRAAGGIYADEPCVVDGQFISGRWPGDLPAYMPKMLQMLESANKPARKAAGAR